MYEAMLEFAGNIPAALGHGKPYIAEGIAADAR
jgi:hypothetical protein